MLKERILQQIPEQGGGKAPATPQLPSQASVHHPSPQTCCTAHLTEVRASDPAFARVSFPSSPTEVQRS